MSFWSNPENNSLKVILVVLIVGVVGFFAYKYMQTNSLGGKGQVINTSKMLSKPSPVTFDFSTETNGNVCTTTVCTSGDSNQCISLSGTVNGAACLLDPIQKNPGAQGLLNSISSQ